MSYNLRHIKVFCGYANTGGIAYKIAEGLRKNNIFADSVVIDNHEFGYAYHYKIKYSTRNSLFHRIVKYYYFFKHILKYDVFIFNTRSTLLSRKWDLRILKLLRKKTAMIYVGCDIRDKDNYLSSSDKYTVCKNCTIEYQKKLNCYMQLKRAETSYIQKYVNASFSHPFDSGILKGKYDYLYLLLELENYIPNYEINEKIKILHAPSNDGIKGTRYILSAIEELASYGFNFEFKLLKNKSNREVISEIRNSDILIDQMVAGWYGLIAIEGMALGKTVVCYIKNELYEYLPDLPIVSLNPDNLSNGLRQLISNRALLREFGKRGRMFAEKYHDYKNNSLKILNKTLGIS